VDEQIPNSAEAPVQTTGPSLYPILAVNFVGTLGYSIILPFLVFLVTRLGGNALIYGIVGATYPAFQLAGIFIVSAGIIYTVFFIVLGLFCFGKDVPAIEGS